MIEAPVLHVNGDDPEAVVYATQLALDFRQQFRKDVVVDIVCFRKLGHNEQDTPAVTQPMMYQKVAQHPGTRKLYADRLATQGVIAADEGDRFVAEYRKAMDEGKHTVDPVITNFKSKFAVDWLPFLNRKWTDSADTAVPASGTAAAGRADHDDPDSFKLHPLVEKVINDRRAMTRGELPLDWGMGEHLAFASPVRRGLRRPAVGPGFRPRHLHAQARGPARPEARALGPGRLHPAAVRLRKPGAVHRH